MQYGSNLNKTVSNVCIYFLKLLVFSVCSQQREKFAKLKLIKNYITSTIPQGDLLVYRQFQFNTISPEKLNEKNYILYLFCKAKRVSKILVIQTIFNHLVLLKICIYFNDTNIYFVFPQPPFFFIYNQVFLKIFFNMIKQYCTRSPY